MLDILDVGHKNKQNHQTIQPKYIQRYWEKKKEKKYNNSVSIDINTLDHTTIHMRHLFINTFLGNKLYCVIAL